KDTITTRIIGSTHISASKPNITRRMVFALTLITFFSSFVTAVFFFFMSSTFPVFMFPPFLSEKRAVLIDLPDNAIGYQHKHESHKGLIQIGRRCHADISVFLQSPVYICINNICNREQRTGISWKLIE